MTNKPTPESLKKMGLEYDPENPGQIRKIGTVLHPAVKAAEDAVANKPKRIDAIEGYVDEPYEENINQEPVVLEFTGPIDGEEWALKNEKAVADLLGAVETKLKKPDMLSISIPKGVFTGESNPGGLLNNIPKMGYAYDGKDVSKFHLDEAGLMAQIDPSKTTGFDIEAAPTGTKSLEKATVPDKKATKHAASKKALQAYVENENNEEFFAEIKAADHIMNVHLEDGDLQRCFVGIDNGVSGSIGIIYQDGTYTFIKTPVKNEQDYTKAAKKINRINGVKLREILSKCGPGSMIMIERPMVNPGMFNATMSAIRAFEATITVLESLNLPYEVTDSKGFQKMFLPTGVFGEQLKPASLQVGNRLFPLSATVKHPDRDGLLIAAFCKQKHK